jgi:hypothetical protein
MTFDTGSEPVPPDHEMTPDPPPSGSERGDRSAVRKTAAEQAEADWVSFRSLPGEHRCLRKTGRNSWEYINENTGTVEIRFSSNFNSRLPYSVFTSRLPSSVSHQGSIYEWRRVGKKKLLASSRVRDLVNVRTGSSAIRRSGVHFGGHAGTKMILGEKEFTFPIRGERPRAVMSAVDGSGNRKVEYRLWSQEGSGWTGLFRPQIDVVVSPQALAVPHVHLLAAVSSRLIWEYFQTDGQI